MEALKNKLRRNKKNVIIEGISIGNVFVFNTPVLLEDGDALTITYKVEGAKAIITQVGILTKT